MRMSEVAHTDLTCKDRHVSGDKVMTSGSLSNVIVSTLVLNTSGVGSNRPFGEVFPIVITPASEVCFSLKGHNNEDGILLLFYTIATLVQLYLCGDMMYEMRRRNPEPTLLQTQGIFKLPHNRGMV